MPKTITNVEFTEDYKWPGKNHHVVFKADLYNAWVDSVMPQFADLPIAAVGDIQNAIPVGEEFLFYVAGMPTTEMRARFLFSARMESFPTSLDMWGHGKSTCSFDDTVRIPILANSRGEPWMSLTPNEVLTQRKLLKVSKGDVGMAGMGLGWLARRVLEKPTVKSLTVYDNNPHVLEFSGKPLEELAVKLNKPLTLVLANAYEVNWTRHTCSIWDIWLRGDDGSNDIRFWTICKKLREQKISCHGWRTVRPSSWCEMMMKEREKCCT